MSAVAQLATDGYLIWWCPGCKTSHAVPTTGPKAWTFNGSTDAPTLAPSVLVNAGRFNPEKDLCHTFVRDGQIEFLSDCTHELAGKTVAMEPVEYPDERIHQVRPNK